MDGGFVTTPASAVPATLCRLHRDLRVLGVRIRVVSMDVLDLTD